MVVVVQRHLPNVHNAFIDASRCWPVQMLPSRCTQVMIDACITLLMLNSIGQLLFLDAHMSSQMFVVLD